MLAKNLLTFDLKFLKIGSDYYSFVKKHPKPKSMSACPLALPLHSSDYQGFLK